VPVLQLLLQHQGLWTCWSTQSKHRPGPSRLQGLQVALPRNSMPHSPRGVGPSKSCCAADQGLTTGALRLPGRSERLDWIAPGCCGPWVGAAPDAAGAEKGGLWYSPTTQNRKQSGGQWGGAFDTPGQHGPDAELASGGGPHTSEQDPSARERSMPLIQLLLGDCRSNDPESRPPPCPRPFLPLATTQGLVTPPAGPGGRAVLEAPLGPPRATIPGWTHGRFGNRFCHPRPALRGLVIWWLIQPERGYDRRPEP